MVSKMDAIVTAGGRISGEFAENAGVEIKALINIAGKPVIESVLEALRGVPEVEKIILIGPEEIRSSSAVAIADEFITESPDGAVNLLMGLERCSGSNRAIYSASDLPFLTSDAINKFLGICAPGGDFYYPIMKKEQFLATFPDIEIEYARLNDGLYTGGCVFLLNPQALLTRRKMITDVFNARKSLVKLASILGIRFVFKMLTHTLTVEDCVRRGSEIIGCDCRVVENCPAELVQDLDDLNDYNHAVRHAEGVNA